MKWGQRQTQNKSIEKEKEKLEDEEPQSGKGYEKPQNKRARFNFSKKTLNTKKEGRERRRKEQVLCQRLGTFEERYCLGVRSPRG